MPTNTNVFPVEMEMGETIFEDGTIGRGLRFTDEIGDTFTILLTVEAVENLRQQFLHAQRDAGGSGQPN